jgi:hypothetical protein
MAPTPSDVGHREVMATIASDGYHGETRNGTFWHSNLQTTTKNQL